MSEKSEYDKIIFSGTASDYFGIWIVNILLSFITLGIYSAWAKVRRLTYFYNNTNILDQSFGYHATGGQIFKGRLIAIAAIFGFSIISLIPIVNFALYLGLVFIIPWVLNSSLKFRAKVTSYRNVRLHWSGTYWKTFMFFVIGPFLGVLTIGILSPYFSKKFYHYYASNHSYGNADFIVGLGMKVRSFYFCFLMSILAFIGIILVAVIASLGIGALFSWAELVEVKLMDSLDTIGLDTIGTGVMMSAYLAFFIAYIMYSVNCRNLLLNNLKLNLTINLHEASEFQSSLNPFRYIWILISNLVIVIFSAGLMIPWASVRRYNYLVNCTEILIKSDLEGAIGKMERTGSALGHEFAEIEGIDVGI